MAEPARLNARELRSWTGYHRMSARFAACLNQSLLKDAGLSYADYEILVALRECPEGRMSAGELRCELRWEKSRLSHQLRRMQERGLVRRETNPADARSAVVRLLDKGRCAIEKATPHHTARLRADLFDLLTEEQIDTLADISETVLAHLERREAEALPDGPHGIERIEREATGR
ncbi:MarR family winged helix-turn-helix transcriptional regulator [Actinorugispora endophytica]|uniref:DNA-binding MarR family transcriptional regulator n=1 Tax=Actinorugispora endophytica TaxID=1605990 RepID=A0A4R6V7K8_9ACTN|nr:MarR family transcriptional regulator [Actinorugispora endophytica]TDQ52283.1 DNA-binding MarR family transcriptional regulator [Actinorugispora endophytica]